MHKIPKQKQEQICTNYWHISTENVKYNYDEKSENKKIASTLKSEYLKMRSWRIKAY